MAGYGGAVRAPPVAPRLLSSDGQAGGPDLLSAKPDAYKKAGVDIDAGEDLVRRISSRVHETFGPNVIVGLGGFCYPLGLEDRSCGGDLDLIDFSL